MKSVFTKIMFIKSLYFERTMKSEMKLCFQYLLELTTLEINATGRMLNTFSDTAYVQQYSILVTLALVK